MWDLLKAIPALIALVQELLGLYKDYKKNKAEANRKQFVTELHDAIRQAKENKDPKPLQKIIEGL